MFGSIHIYFYVLPLILVLSLVYSASRYEALTKILSQSVRLFGVILGVLVVCTLVLSLINLQV